MQFNITKLLDICMFRLGRCLFGIIVLLSGYTAVLGASGGWAGIGWHAWTKEEIAAAGGHPRGSRIIWIVRDSPAANAGLKAGDIALSIDGSECNSPAEFAENVFAAGSGAVVNLTVARNGAELAIPVRLQSYETAPPLLRAEAEAGDIAAMLMLGNLAARGQEALPDYVEARRWFLMAAKKGQVDAMIALGNLAKLGKGMDVNIDEARSWYQRALDAGDARGAIMLKYFLRRGAPDAPHYSSWPPGLETEIGSQIWACWKPKKEWPRVTVTFELSRGGTLSDEPQVLIGEAKSPEAAKAAVGAVNKCQPFRLPAGQYDAWKSVVWAFDPAIMPPSK